MKTIKDLTEQDCIHCATQEEFNAVLAEYNPLEIDEFVWSINRSNTVIYYGGTHGSYECAEEHGYTIHPASDFLTPQVSVLTEIGDTKVIKNGGDVIVMTGNVVITLTPPVLKHIQELLNQQQ